jgi:serine/threonine-protein kinase
MRLMRDLVGETLSGRYRMVARIAGGGMGEVYRAHDLLLDRPVAIKVLQPSLANDPALVDRFRAEARAAARLSHPNVVAVHDWGSEDDRTYFMVMEYVAGTDLRDILVGRGPLDPGHATEVVISICDALEAAHSTGLVHRDVKPENVLIARDGTVKVADFGIAAVADAERTMPGGTIMGTLRYLSPEQAAGEKATAASDIWAAGAVFFELLIGTPMPSGSGAELIRRRATEPPVPPSKFEPEIPAVLDNIVLKACAVDPAERFASAAHMIVALKEAVEQVGPRVKPVKELLIDVTEEIRVPTAISPVPPAVQEPKRKRGRDRVKRRFGFGRLALVLLLLGGLGLGGWQATSAFFGPKEVEVPSLLGLTEAEALERAEENGFSLVCCEEKRDPSYPAGQIMEQTPLTGLLLQGEAITAVVSKGPPLAKVPNLVGRELPDARERLDNRNLAAAVVGREFSLEQPKGMVVSQNPESGGARIEWGTTVELVVSKGPRSLEVPSVRDMKEDDAVAAIRSAGFEPVVVRAHSDDVKKGRAIGTNPAAGEEADEASQVQVVISEGRDAKAFRMPDVRGDRVKEAERKLQNLGLIVESRRSCPGGRKVRATDPQPGSRVREGDRVTLYLCN